MKVPERTMVDSKEYQGKAGSWFRFGGQAAAGAYDH
jgi:hypothetical protein